MGSFEKIVRPYESPNVTPPKREYAANLSGADAPIHLRIGLGSGGGKVFTGQNTLQSTVYVIRKPKEKQKK